MARGRRGYSNGVVQAALLDRQALLGRRWRGIWAALRRWCMVGGPLLATGPLLGWETPAVVGGSALLLGLGDFLLRSARTLFLSQVLDGPVQQVQVTRHHRYRHKIPDLEVAGLWPDGVVDGREPPLSVRVEDVGPPLDDGATVEVVGDLGPGRWVVLVADGQVVWPVRRVKRGLHYRNLGAYEAEDD